MRLLGDYIEPIKLNASNVLFLYLKFMLCSDFDFFLPDILKHSIYQHEQLFSCYLEVTYTFLILWSLVYLMFLKTFPLD